MSKVIFQIEGGSAVTIECNQGDNLLKPPAVPTWPSTRPAPATVPAANAG